MDFDWQTNLSAQFSVRPTTHLQFQGLEVWNFN